MKKYEAKPCPFCGWPVVEGIVDGGKYYIRCRSCKARTRSFIYWADAVNAWNRRVEEENKDV